VLSNALRAAALVDEWRGPGPFTVFAPTDAAFRKIPREALNALLKDKARLGALLGYHVVPGKLMAREFRTGDLDTVQGTPVRLLADDGIRIANARIMKTDIEASNGVIHSIDTVLEPA
jgi:uncharacterized surface protein with fasciclin (FAS1) repeats